MNRWSRARLSWSIVILLWCVCGPASVRAEDAAVDKNSTRGVDEFLTSLTQMIGSVLNSDPRYSLLLDDVALQSVDGRPNRRPVTDFFETGRPPFLGPLGVRPFPPPQDGRPYPPPQDGGPFIPSQNGGPFPPPQDGRPFPPPDFPGQGGQPGFLGGRPPYPYGPYPGGPGSRYPQQNSIIQALSSISQHDDLRCVPRLLCEVSSGTRPSSGYYQQPGYYQQQQQQSSIPFLTKDALITLLTVLNFVDDSPLLMFGRAALLGYNARGDPRSCTTAYPTCPRDPDQLINYLNNHNGGFFRFFNQQLPQYAPQYGQQFGNLQPGYPQPGYPRPEYPQPGHPQPPFQRPPIQQLPFTPLQQRPPYPPQQYASQFPRPQQQFSGGYKARSDGIEDQQKPRILSGSPEQYYDVPSVQDLALEVPRPSMKFPSTKFPSMKFPSNDVHGGASANHVSSFAFPSDGGDGNRNDDRYHRQGKKIKMVFPDRTGTGGLRADLDKYGNYKGVYYADGVIKFVDDHDHGNNRRPSKIRLPQSPYRPADDFDVGNRLPYEKRPKFQFPKTV